MHIRLKILDIFSIEKCISFIILLPVFVFDRILPLKHPLQWFPCWRRLNFLNSSARVFNRQISSEMWKAPGIKKLCEAVLRDKASVRLSVIKKCFIAWRRMFYVKVGSDACETRWERDFLQRWSLREHLFIIQRYIGRGLGWSHWKIDCPCSNFPTRIADFVNVRSFGFIDNSRYYASTSSIKSLSFMV